MLTALGIIFGVGAVIAMLAIGQGAQQEILEQMEMVGVNNVVINPLIPESSSGDDGEREQRKFSRGLSMLDVEAIREILPSVRRISPEISFNSTATMGGVRHTAKLVGISNDYFELYNLPLSDGTFFNDYHEENGITVCVIGANIRAKFFNKVDPIGQYVKINGIWLRVIGVLRKTNVSLTGFEEAGVNVYNDNIYIPINTMLLRFQNRALVNTRQSTDVSASVQMIGGMMMRTMTSGSDAAVSSSTNYNQLDRIVVQVSETEHIQPTTEILSRMLARRHSEVKDFEITVPELLLKQQQRTKDIFNIVLGAIAGISLLVGGIGIMNIMFASVMERIKEIGTRMAKKKKKMDIVVQFLSEAVLISVSGGFIGVFLGVVMAKLIEQVAGIMTIVSFLSVFIAFGVSAAIGVIFGYSPAKRASEKDPIESLRYE
jgi:putative ABC transport system permease protein